MQGPLVEHCKNTLKTFYEDDPQTSESFGRIVNSRHFKYVTSLCGRLHVQNLSELILSRSVSLQLLCVALFSVICLSMTHIAFDYCRCPMSLTLLVICLHASTILPSPVHK